MTRTCTSLCARLIAMLLITLAVSPLASARADAASGSLTWGIKASWLAYIAAGDGAPKFALSDGATWTGAEGASALAWPQASTTVVDATGVGTTSYQGAVRLQYPGHGIDMTFANPALTVAADGVSTLSIEIDGARVDLLDVQQGAPGAGEGTLTWSNRTTTQLASCAVAFCGYYAPGTPYDVLTAVAAVAGVTPVAGGGTGEPPASTQGPTPLPATPTPTAVATPTASTKTAKAGYLDWGVKAAFRSYVTGPIAQGSISVSGRASAKGSAIRFAQTSTSAKLATASVNGSTTKFGGAVTFSGHHGELSLTLRDPWIKITSTKSAMLSAVTSHGRITIATLDLSAAAKRKRGGAVVFSSVPAAMSAAGAQLFSYNGTVFPGYEPGSALDPVNFAIGSTGSASGSAAGKVVASAPKKTAAAAAPTPTPSAVPTASAPLACNVTSATLVWGFKESFRSYISGTIANGSWDTTGNVSYKTPVFTIAGGTGSLDETASKGAVSFTGSMHFTGHSGALDTTFSDPVLEIVDATTALLYVDVASAPREAAEAGDATIHTYDDIPFVRIDLASATAGSGSISGSALPTALTSEGNTVFSSYEVGSAFDPIDVSVASSCAAPASAPTPAPTPTPTPTLTPTARAELAAGAGSSGDWPWWSLGMVATFAAGLGLGRLLPRIRKQVTA